MAHQTTKVNTWEQLPLFHAHDLEFTLKFGVLAVDNHVQAQVEVRRIPGQELVGMMSIPHTDLASLPAALDRAVAELHKAVYTLVDPFPVTP